MLAYAKYDGDKSMAFKDMCHRFNLAFNDTEYKQNYREWNNAILQWHNDLTDDDIDYLHQRKINDSTINNLYIGSHTFKEKLPTVRWWMYTYHHTYLQEQQLRLLLR